MSKAKFVLTEDLIKIEPEPKVLNKEKSVQKIMNSRDRISLNIDSSLKKCLHIYCINNNKKMTEVIDLAIKIFLDKNIK